MGRVSPAFLPVVFLVAWVCGATRAHADQIRVTSGQFNAFAFVGQAVNSASGIDLVGPDGTRLLLSSFEEVDHSIRLTNLPTIPGQGELADFSSVLTVLPGGDSIFAPDLSGRALATPSTLSFVAAPTQVVCHDNVFRGLVCGGVAPFTFNASLMFGGGPTTVDLIGAGTVEAEFFGDAVRLNYVFEASPTPEPATVSLLTTGLIMGGAGILRRRRAGGART
jgi:hypothetical protein